MEPASDHLKSARADTALQVPCGCCSAGPIRPMSAMPYREVPGAFHLIKLFSSRLVSLGIDPSLGRRPGLEPPPTTDTRPHTGTKKKKQ